MRRNKEDDGLFGIRTTVWLFAFGFVFGCMGITAPRHREPPVPGIAPDETAHILDAGFRQAPKWRSGLRLITSRLWMAPQRSISR